MSRTRLSVRILSYAALALGAVLLGGAGYEARSRAVAHRDVTMRGSLVDVGDGRRVQIDCRGSGSPVVVLESGLDSYGAMAWSAVHDSIAQTTRTCAYSRPGILWSDASQGAFDSRSLAHDLRAALKAVGASPPFVMAGHSLGGPYIVAFTQEYPRDVAGLVFVDASHFGQFPRFRRIAGKSLQPTSTLPRAGSALAWTGLVRSFPAGGSGNAQQDSVDLIASRFLPLSVGELAREVDAISTTLASMKIAHALGDRPTVVLTAARGMSVDQLKSSGITIAQGHALRDVARALHADIASWSTHSRQEIVAGASHYIQFDRPDRVIAAVREVVSATRAK